MKNIIILIVCAAIVAVFFACSNESFDIRPVNPPDTNVLCEWQEPYSCMSINKEVCLANGGTALESGQNCLPPIPSSSSISIDNSSSSSDGISSSSIVQSSSSSVEGTSSSAIAGSSSSVFVPSSSSGPPLPDPIVSGRFEFRYFDSSSSGKGVYFVGTNNMRTSDNDGSNSENPATPEYSGKLLYKLTIENATAAQCEAILLEATLADIPIELRTNANVDREGTIVATAYAMCGGVKKILKTAEAEVISPPLAEPEVEGNLEFRFFDAGGKYHVGTINMRVSLNAGGTQEYSGKIYNGLAIVNKTVAACGDITIKLSLNGQPLPPISQGTQPDINAEITAPGTLVATAYATCNLIEKQLRSIEAEVVNGP